MMTWFLRTLCWAVNVVQDSLGVKDLPTKKLDEIIARNFDFGNNQKTLTYKTTGNAKTKQK